MPKELCKTKCELTSETCVDQSKIEKYLNISRTGYVKGQYSN